MKCVVKYMLLFMIFIIAFCGYESCQYEKRLGIYSIAFSLKPGMQKSEVLGIIKKHQGSHMNISYSDDGNSLNLSTYTGFGSFCRLKIVFENDHLISAKIRGEDSPNQTFADAPPDIVPASK